MKNFVKNLSVYLTVVMCLIGCVSFAIPGFAAEDEVIAWSGIESQASPYYFDENNEIKDDGVYSEYLYVANSVTSDDVSELMRPGKYYVSGCVAEGTFPSAPLQVYFVVVDSGLSPVSFELCPLNSVFEVPEGLYGVVVAQSWHVEPVLYRVSENTQPEGLYYEAYDLFRELIFDPDFEITPPQEWCLAILATITTLFIIVIPFIVVWLVLTSLGRWR